MDILLKNKVMSSKRCIKETQICVIVVLFGIQLYSTHKRFISVYKLLLKQCKKIKILQSLTKIYFEFIFSIMPTSTVMWCHKPFVIR